MNTKITLAYTDADNYKSSLSVVLQGSITDDHIQRIKQAIHPHYFIIAHQVGLPSPIEQMEYGLTQSDHVYTELTDFQVSALQASQLHTNQKCSLHLDIDTLVSRIEAYEPDIFGEMERLGIPDEDLIIIYFNDNLQADA